MPLASRLPTSNAYWNLRAEQVMDKVFEHNVSSEQKLLGNQRLNADERHVWPVDVAIEEPTSRQPDVSAATEPVTASNWLVPLLTSIAAAGVVSCGWLIGNWQTSQAQLEQQRNLLLLERLRREPVRPTATATPKPSPALRRGSLPQQSPVLTLQPLTLPIQQRPASTSPPDSGATATTEAVTPHPAETPQLTGVVKGPGGSSSAIFQLGAASLSTGIGETIGSSGWTLDSISDSGAVIRSGDQRRSLSVGGVF